MGGSIKNTIVGKLAELIAGSIKNGVEEKKADSVAGLVDDDLVAELAAEKVEAMETSSSSDIKLVIYTYGGE